MSLWQRFRDSFRGPLHVQDSEDDDAEVEADLDEEMPAAAEDAREMAERPGKVAAEMDPPGGWVESPLAPGPPDTIALEGAEADAAEEASETEPEHSS